MRRCSGDWGSRSCARRCTPHVEHRARLTTYLQLLVPAGYGAVEQETRAARTGLALADSAPSRVLPPGPAVPIVAWSLTGKNKSPPFGQAPPAPRADVRAL